jgi:SAM-dependent methyltransferase
MKPPGWSPMQKVERRKLPRSKIVDRDTHFLAICRGRSVLHIGCTDAPFTQAKVAAGNLLHAKLETVAAKLIGIDLDEASVRWLTEKGFRDLHVADAGRVREFLGEIGFSPEVIVAGEVLEHLASPLDFLSGIRRAMQGGEKLLVSVPNAFWIEGFLHVLLGREKVHPEHVSYYSYYTIAQLLARADLVMQDCRPCSYQATTRQKAISDAFQVPLTWLSPHFAPGYAVTAVAAG